MQQASLCKFKREFKFDIEEKNVAVEIQKTLCGGINTENLIESICLYLKISQFHVFCLNFSRVFMFCNDECSELVPESTRPGGVPS